MNRFSGDITPAFASGNRGMQPLTDEQERLQRLLEAIILKTPGGVAKSIGEGIQTGVDVVGSIGQLDKAEQLGRQARRTLPDIVSAVTEQPGAVASALGQGLEQDVLDKGLGAFVGVEDAVPVVGKAGKFMGGIGAAAMMSKMPKMSKELEAIADASNPAMTDRGRRNVELAQEQIAAGETPGASVKAKIAESNAEIGKTRKEIEDLLPEDEDKYRFNIIQSQFKNGETTEYELLRQLSNEFYDDAEEISPTGQSRAKKLYDLLIRENTLETRSINNDFVDKLDDAEKARLDRAVKQGFDIDAFHGTKGEIKYFDESKLGKGTKAPSAKQGFFFSADPATAEVYTETGKLSEIQPQRYEQLKRSFKNPYMEERIKDTNERYKQALQDGDMKEAMFLYDELQDLQVEYDVDRHFELNLSGQLGQNIMPVKLKLENPLEHDFEGSSYREVTYDNLLKKARDAGHDGAIFRNTTDGAGITDIYVVFEPNQIRSRFATFDPVDKKARNLIASAPPVLFPLGVSAAAAAYTANEE